MPSVSSSSSSSGSSVLLFPILASPSSCMPAAETVRDACQRAATNMVMQWNGRLHDVCNDTNVLGAALHITSQGCTSARPSPFNHTHPAAPLPPKASYTLFQHFFPTLQPPTATHLLSLSLSLCGGSLLLRLSCFRCPRGTHFPGGREDNLEIFSVVLLKVPSSPFLPPLLCGAAPRERHGQQTPHPRFASFSLLLRVRGLYGEGEGFCANLL
jgi:hypothetical protein